MSMGDLDTDLDSRFSQCRELVSLPMAFVTLAGASMN